MTKTEWIERCAAQYMKRGGLTQDQATEAAQVTYAAEIGEGETEETRDPEEAADDDMDCWTDDGEE